MVNENKDLTPKHPIGVVVSRTGISADLLRVWERRYRAVVPTRTPTGRRLYTDADIGRLVLLKQVIAAGRRISDVAGLGLAELKALVEEDRRAPGRSERAGRGDDAEVDSPRYLERALDAVVQYDGEALERTVAVAALTMDPSEFRRGFIEPLLDEIGERWMHGELRIVQEHMASAVVKAFLEALRKRSFDGSRPKIVVTTPAGQTHEMGALMAASVAEEAGWAAVYLGANLPADEIVEAARRLGARAVAVSVTYDGGNDAPALEDEIRTIGRSLGPEIALIVGGRAAERFADAVGGSGGMVVGDLEEFRHRIERIRSA
ncbi:MAG: cobalamin-dependent protein [bacterium]